MDYWREVVAAILATRGVDPASTISAAQTEANKQRLRERTELAQAQGMFGAPIFFVNGEMFWGNDRLEDALQLACSLPSIE